MNFKLTVPKMLMVALTGVIALGGCSVPISKDQDYPEYDGDKDTNRERIEALEGGKATLFGEFSLGGDDKKRGEGEGFSTVNYYLWRATLETLSLGPLESADPFGGVVITDWFTLENDPGSQYRVTAYILGRELRTDNIKVALYIKTRDRGRLVTRKASSIASTKLEDVILAKARDIRSTQFK